MPSALKAKTAPKPNAKAQLPKKIGPPSKYTDAVVAEICARLAEGEPLAVICRDKHLPSVTSCWTWQQERPGLAERFARARETGWDRIAWSARNTARGQGDSTGDVQRDKLIIDTDLKLLAKWDAKRYGDKMAVVGGSEGDAPVQHRVEVVFVAPGSRPAIEAPVIRGDVVSVRED